MDINYIIVQAGGKGTRMGALTKNKPKALVPVNNLPLIFHLFRKFPDKKFIIIGDYKSDVLEKYLAVFAEVDYTVVNAAPNIGTCAGLSSALSGIPDNAGFLLIWCDLLLPEDYTIPDTENNVIGISKDFPCRWKYENSVFQQEESTEHGVAGHFIFQNKSFLKDVPSDGEFVRWLSDKGMTFEEQPLYQTREYGLYSEWEKLPTMKCRPFNSVEIRDGYFYKRAIDTKQGIRLAAREAAWYKLLQEQNFDAIPKIYAYPEMGTDGFPTAMCMELINGKNIYEYDDIPDSEKVKILHQLIQCLKRVHNTGSVPSDRGSYRVAYLDKTYDRLEKVRNLVPFANDEKVTVNGRECRNIFFHKEEIESLVMSFFPESFSLIHGDCTFSNIMLREDKSPVLIDPRGYFGNTELYGDTAYDWAKLYYSLYSNYDQFNLKRFRLDIQSEKVEIEIASNHWESMKEMFFLELDGEVSRVQMDIFLALIWLSLTTYAWEDYDSICGAFYYGLYLLEDALREADASEGAWKYFEDNHRIIERSLRSIDKSDFERLIDECEKTIRVGNKIIASGLGKNVPICEKFVGTMLSMGLNAGFLHTNSAVHGDMGMIHTGDLVILLTKSGSTVESVYLAELIQKRENVKLWLVSFNEHGPIADKTNNKVIIRLEHEGDKWDIVPNNSTTVNLVVLQTIAIELSKRLDLQLEVDFKPNHPGGAIGEHLRDEQQ